MNEAGLRPLEEEGGPVGPSWSDVAAKAVVAGSISSMATICKLEQAKR